MNSSIRLFADKFKTIMNDDDKSLYDPLKWMDEFKKLL